MSLLRESGGWRILERKQIIGLAWLIGCIPALGESARLLLSTYDRGITEAILISLGVFPLMGMILGMIASLFPFLRKGKGGIVIVTALMLFPWILGIMFPVISIRSLLMAANASKVAGVFILCLLIAREVGSRHAWLVRFIPRSIPVMLFPLFFLIIAGVLNIPGESDEPIFHSSGDSAKPNCILISIDTLRKDELTPWGSDRSVAPTLDSLAGAGTVFKDCYSTAPWTMASIASFMTGEYPSSINVLTGEHYLSDNAKTLSERLHEHGYYTHAIISNIWLREQFGFAQGFDQYDHRRPPDEHSALQSLLPIRIFERLTPDDIRYQVPESASDLGSRVVDFLRADHPRPFFLWVHFNDVHDPYAPPTKYIPRGGAMSSIFTYTSGRIVTLRMGRRLSAADRHRLRSLYRGEITYVDEQLRAIFNVLRAEGLDAETVVAVTSDHGEEFWDHESVGHGHSVFDELVRVPLIFSCPGTIPAGAVRRDPASLIDLVPTILSLLGESGADRLVGENLFSVALPVDRPRFVEGLEFYREQKGVISGSWKLAYTPDTRRSRLYDTSSDPGEMTDISTFHKDRTAEMIALLEDHRVYCRERSDSLSLHSPKRNMVLTPRIREMLRAQGYIE